MVERVDGDELHTAGVVVRRDGNVVQAQLLLVVVPELATLRLRQPPQRREARHNGISPDAQFVVLRLKKRDVVLGPVSASWEQAADLANEPLAAAARRGPL